MSMGTSAIEPEGITNFVRSIGWVESVVVEAQRDAYAAFRAPTDAGSYVLIPHSVATDADSDLIEIAVDRLAQITGRPRAALAMSLAHGTSDSWDLRLPDVDATGMVSIREFEALAANVPTMFRALSESALESVGSMTGKKPPMSSLSFVERMLVGPPTPGSFVLTVFVPLGPTVADSDALTSRDDDPVGRIVNQRMLEHVHAAHHALERADKIGVEAAFKEAQRSTGLTAKVCRALANVIREVGDTVEIRLEPAPERPKQWNMPSVHKFAETSHEVLERAVQVLTPPMIETVSVVGTVEMLRREARATDGKIVVTGFIEGGTGRRSSRPGKIHMILSPAMYRVANQANEERRIVAARGEIQKRGNTSWLSTVDAFGIIEAAPALEPDKP